MLHTQCVTLVFILYGSDSGLAAHRPHTPNNWFMLISPVFHDCLDLSIAVLLTNCTLFLYVCQNWGMSLQDTILLIQHSSLDSVCPAVLSQQPTLQTNMRKASTAQSDHGLLSLKFPKEETPTPFLRIISGAAPMFMAPETFSEIKHWQRIGSFFSFLV